MARRAGAVLVLLVLALRPAAGDGIAAPAPFVSRDSVFASTMASGAATLVYGTARPALTTRYRTALEDYVRRPRGLFRRLRPAIVSDAAASPDSLPPGLTVLVGTPGSNRRLAAVIGGLPVRYTPGGIEFLGRTYSDSSDVLSLAYPDPRNPRMLLICLMGRTDEAVLRHLQAPAAPIWAADYVVWRHDEEIRRGQFSEAEGRFWQFDPARDEDRLGWREAYEKDLTTVEGRAVRLHIPRSVAAGLDTRRLAALLDARAARMAGDLDLASVDPPLDIDYYPDAETKGKLTGSVLMESAAPGGRLGHRVFDPGRPEGDGLAEAELLLDRALGPTDCGWLRAGSLVWLAQGWLGVPLAAWPGRLAGMGQWLPAAQLTRPDGFDGRSCFFTWPAAGARVGRLVDTRGREAWRRLYRASQRSAALPESDLAGLEMPEPAPRAGGIPGRPRLNGRPGFDRGICYAHEYSLDTGYISSRGRDNLRYLRDQDGVGAVAVNTFGYLASDTDPAIECPYRRRGDGSAGEENDESIVAVTRNAHALGLKTILAPHLWGRVWCGQWHADDEAGWRRLFDEYERFILHYAALAEYAGCDLFVIGKELGATTGREADWRRLIARIRRVYTGPLTYGANWDGEYGRIAWWDAVDYIGVSQYTPLAAGDDPGPAELAAGAAAVADSLDAVSRRFGRPYLLTEVGFTARQGAAREPWVSSDEHGRTPASGNPDLELQARCYDAILSVFTKRPACAGMYWWKWFTELAGNNEGNNRFDYPPYGKPAEKVMAQWYRGLAQDGR